MELFLAPGMVPFTSALVVLVALVMIEAVLLVMGMGSAGADHGDLGDVGETDFATEAEGMIGKALAFVGFRRVPAMVVLMVLAGTFGGAGTILQMAAGSVLGTHLPLAAAAALAGFASVAATGRISRAVARLLPSLETSAVRSDSLIGAVAEITYGSATTASVASARVRDGNGNMHFIQVRASIDGDAFSVGDKVLLASRLDGFFIGAEAPADHH